MIRCSKIVGLALAMLLLPSVAEAQFQLGARLGYSLPGGSIFKDMTLQNFTSSQVPIELDLGYRFTPEFSLTFYAAYAPGAMGDFTKGICAGAGETCSTYGGYYGLEAAWNFAPKAGMQPWLGVRIGSENLGIDEKLGGASSTLSSNAFAFGLSGGLDFALGKVNLGPYLSYSMSKFTSFKSSGAATVDIPSDQRTYHNWLTIGARALVTF
jgi:hypothetical protein